MDEASRIVERNGTSVPANGQRYGRGETVRCVATQCVSQDASGISGTEQRLLWRRVLQPLFSAGGDPCGIVCYAAQPLQLQNRLRDAVTRCSALKFGSADTVRLRYVSGGDTS